MKIDNLSKNASDFTGNIWKLENKDVTVLIDVGTGDSWEQIRELEKVDKVVITHSHHDHVDNLPKVKDKYNPEIYAYEPENLPVKASKLDEDEIISVAGLKFRIIYTPGHKDDSISLYNDKRRILFTGDLIFPEGGFGRTDLEEGDRDQLIRSIEKIEPLKVEKMYCGHESATTKDVESQIEKSLEQAGKMEPKY